MLWRSIQFPWTWTSGLAPPPIPFIPPGSMLYLDIPETLIFGQVALPAESAEFPVPSKGIRLTYQITYNNPSANVILFLEAALATQHHSLLQTITQEGLVEIISGATFIKVTLDENPDQVSVTVRAVAKRRHKL